MLKWQIVSRGATIVSPQNYRDGKHDVFRRRLHFLFLRFLCYRKTTEKNKTKKKLQKEQKIIVFGWVRNKVNFVNGFCWKSCKTLLVFGRQKTRRETYSFAVFFVTKSRITTEIGVSTGTGETENSSFFEKACSWKGSRKGFYYLRSTKAVLCWKHNFYSVFSKTQLLQRKGCKLPKKEK